MRGGAGAGAVGVDVGEGEMVAAELQLVHDPRYARRGYRVTMAERLRISFLVNVERPEPPCRRPNQSHS